MKPAQIDLSDCVLIERFPHVVTLRTTGSITRPAFEAQVREWARENIPNRLRMRFFEFREIHHPDMKEIRDRVMGNGPAYASDRGRWFNLLERTVVEADVASDDLNGLLMLKMVFS